MAATLPMEIHLKNLILLLRMLMYVIKNSGSFPPYSNFKVCTHKETKIKV